MDLTQTQDMYIMGADIQWRKMVMQVIKRNGKIVDFDQTKIEIAIGKANAELKPSQRATKQEIHEIINHIKQKENVG